MSKERLMKHYPLTFTIFLVLILFPTYAFAAPLPFMPEKDPDRKIEAVSGDSLFGGILNDLEELLGPVYGYGVTIITAFFIIGSVVMVMSILFKNGQWQKYGQTTMLFSFLGMMTLRGLPVVVLSIHSMADLGLLLHYFLKVLSYSTVFIAFVGIAASFLFRFGHRLIDHPDFYRWSKNLFTVSLIMMSFAIAIPLIFPAI